MLKIPLTWLSQWVSWRGIPQCWYLPDRTNTWMLWSCEQTSAECHQRAEGENTIPKSQQTTRKDHPKCTKPSGFLGFKLLIQARKILVMCSVTNRIKCGKTGGWGFCWNDFTTLLSSYPKWGNVLHQLKAHSRKRFMKLFQVISAISLENPGFKGCSWELTAKFNGNHSFKPKVSEGGETQSSYKSQTKQNTDAKAKSWSSGS